MKCSSVFRAGIIAAMALLSVACSKVPVGHVGVKAHLLGGSKGVASEELRQNPATIELSAIEKWDGKLPVTQAGGAVPFIQVPSGR